MTNPKVFILAYAKQNLGDDLFVVMLCKKYPQISFYINISDKNNAKAFEEIPNITIIPEKERILTKENAKDYDAYIYIGGSIFMEGGVVYNITEDFLEFLKECKRLQIPFHYVSSNFGPYHTKEYLELAGRVYKNSTICFRDKYSYELFKQIPTVSYAPDLAFCYQTLENINIRKNTVGISLIDMEIRKDLKFQEENYYEMLIHNIIDYIQSQKEIYLFSFCKYEGDENSISKLKNKLPVEYQDKVHAVYYRGDLDSFMKQYKSMEYMICSRFHAMVLSVVFGQKCRIMSYSNKIDNVIKDLTLFDQEIIHFKDLTQNTKMPLESFEKVEEKKVKEIAKQAEKQLEKVNETMIQITQND